MDIDVYATEDYCDDVLIMPFINNLRTMKKLFKKMVSLIPLFGILFLATPFAQAHFLGYSAVDSGEIRCGSSTTYSTQWSAAISTWNALGVINIAPDTIFTLEDLTVSDIYEPGSGWTGLYTPSAGADDIELNTYYLSGDTNAERKNTATHELGHALGLAHSDSGQIMYSVQTSQTALGDHDIDDYYTLY